MKRTKLDSIKAKFDVAKAAVKDQAKDALTEMFISFFEVHPEVSAVRWSQYTPYFNDGDACVFRVNSELDFELDGVSTADDAEDGDGWHDSYTLYDYDNASRSKTYVKELGGVAIDGHKLHNALEELGAYLDEEVCLYAFGDHVLVTATKDGFEADEYRHD